MATLIPEYTMLLHSNDLGITVTAALPDTFAFDVASDYQAPFAQGINVSDSVANGLRLVGMSLTNQAMTAADRLAGREERGTGDHHAPQEPVPIDSA